MGAELRILSREGKTISSNSIPQAGSFVSLVVENGEMRPDTETISEATWTYNYHAIWLEIGWSPWDWIDKDHGGKVEIGAEVVQLLIQKLSLVLALPCPDQDRLITVGGYWAATPHNAAVMLTWLLTWVTMPEAVFITVGSR